MLQFKAPALDLERLFQFLDCFRIASFFVLRNNLCDTCEDLGQVEQGVGMYWR